MEGTIDEFDALGGFGVGKEGGAGGQCKVFRGEVRDQVLLIVGKRVAFDELLALKKRESRLALVSSRSGVSRVLSCPPTSELNDFRGIGTISTSIWSIINLTSFDGAGSIVVWLTRTCGSRGSWMESLLAEPEPRLPPQLGRR